MSSFALAPFLALFLAIWVLPPSLCFTIHPLATTSTVRSTHRASRQFLNLNHEDHHDERRSMEFTNIEPLPETDVRRKRIKSEKAVEKKFVEFGDELWDLRSEMDYLSSELVQAITEGRGEVEEYMRKKLRKAEQQDPELVYMLELAALEEATQEGRDEDAAEHRERALAARSCLPHFNLDGLWVGKYGNHGYELVNITYVEDILVATKVTGDRNVPRSEITFQVDLSPLRHRNSPNGNPYGINEALEPICLSDKAAMKWGTRKLSRYAALGHVAEDGFRNSQWMDGQLIIIGSEYFSFAWIPIEQQIFFGRPSPELALKMLRVSGVASVRSSETFDIPPSLDADVDMQKSFAMRCLEKTQEYEDDLLDGHAFSCIWDDTDTAECHFE